MQLFIFYLLLFVQLIIFECHSHLSNIWFVWVFPEESSCVFSCQARKFLYPSCILVFCFYFLSMSVYSLTGSSAWQQTISLVMQKGNIKFTQLNLHIYTIKWREKKRQIRSFTGSCRISTCVSRMLWSAPVHSTTKPIFSFFHFVCKWILRGTSRADE